MTKTQDQLHIAFLQLTSLNDIKKNDAQIRELLGKIKNINDIDIISLPENSFFMRIQDGEKAQYLELNHPVWDFYKEFAQKHDLMIHVGATPLSHDGKNWNATVLIMPDGTLQTPYQKIHLFDIQLENQKPVRESDLFEKGSHPRMVEFRGWKLGFTICYDIRFTELFLYYQKHEVDVIFIPSAFLVPTGKAHWEILNRARAIEAQAYVVSAAQGGTHSETRQTFGHSMVVDPWGTMIAQITSVEKPAFAEAILQKDVLHKVRAQIPMKSHRRLKVEF